MEGKVSGGVDMGGGLEGIREEECVEEVGGE